MRTQSNEIQNIERYILKVIDDACQAERRENRSKMQLCILDNTVMVAFRTGFDRVDRRVVYRLIKNFERNFEKEISIDNPNGRVYLHDWIPNTKYQLQGDDGIDPNHSIASCKILGKFQSIVSCQKGPYINPDFEESAERGFSILYKKIRELYPEAEYLHYEGESGWKQYCVDYKKLYGHEPLAEGKVIVGTYYNLGRKKRRS